jgi:hypothetical protein
VSRASLALLLGVVALLVAACGGGASDAVQDVDARVVPLRNVDQLASAFEADRGKPRVVLLLSPT